MIEWRKRRLELCFFEDFQQWKDSMAMEVRMPGGLSSESREKVEEVNGKRILIGNSFDFLVLDFPGKTVCI